MGWGGVFDREFTKSLIIRDFDDVLKNPFTYVHVFLLHTLSSKKISSSKLRCNTPPPLNEGLALINPVLCSTSSTYQKHLKLGQCLEIDYRRSLSKFGDVTLPSLYFRDLSVFYRSAFYRLVCKIVNLWDIDLKFLGSLSDVDIDNYA